jgi:hypothetical protein
MLSHHHKTIFVHIPKCGGMTVERLFLDDLGLTMDSGAPLLLRDRVKAEPAPPRVDHMTALNYVQGHYLSPDLFDQYFKFALVRNPYDRAWSSYRYLGLDLMMSFDDYILRYLRQAVTQTSHVMNWFFMPQVNYIYRGTEQLVDEIIHLEEIDLRLPEVLERSGLHIDEVPHVNRDDHRSALKALRLIKAAIRQYGAVPSRLRPGRAQWTTSLRLAVEGYYKDDFSMLGYPS